MKKNTFHEIPLLRTLIGLYQRDKGLLVQDSGILAVALLFQGLHVSLGTEHGVLNQITDDGKEVGLTQRQKLAEAKNLQTVGINDFIAAGFISSSQLVKVLGNGTLTAKLDVQAHAFSKTAVAAIEAAGGQVVKL